MKLASQKDFFSGLMFTIVGGSFAMGATSFEVGTAARMGPGYFPLLLGVLLTILGILIAGQSFRSKSPDGDPIGPAAQHTLPEWQGRHYGRHFLLCMTHDLFIPFGRTIVEAIGAAAGAWRCSGTPFIQSRSASQ